MMRSLFNKKKNQIESIDTLKESHKLTFPEGEYEVISYGLMSKRQYFEAREDYLIESIISNKFKKLAYLCASYGLQPMRLSNFGLVYALEPVSCIYDALVANIINNAKHGVIPVKLGLGIVHGSVQIKHSGHTGGTPSLNTDYGSQITEQIGLISLESAFFSDIDTVVMDIEGYEFDCLMNLKFVHESICSIFVELHPTFYKGETTDLINKMYNLGFKASYIGQRNEQNHVLFKKIDI